MNKTETITWHKYPDEKPPDITGRLLIQTVNRRVHIRFYYGGSPNNGIFTDNVFDLPRLRKSENPNFGIIAWAEMPKGHKEER